MCAQNQYKTIPTYSTFPFVLLVEVYIAFSFLLISFVSISIISCFFFVHLFCVAHVVVYVCLKSKLISYACLRWVVHDFDRPYQTLSFSFPFVFIWLNNETSILDPLTITAIGTSWVASHCVRHDNTWIRKVRLHRIRPPFLLHCSDLNSWTHLRKSFWRVRKTKWRVVFYLHFNFGTYFYLFGELTAINRVETH